METGNKIDEAILLEYLSMWKHGLHNRKLMSN